MQITTFSFIEINALRQKYKQFKVYLSEDKRIFKLCNNNFFSNAFLIKSDKQLCDCFKDKFEFLTIDLNSFSVIVDKNYRDVKLKISERPIIRPIIVRNGFDDKVK